MCASGNNSVEEGKDGAREKGSAKEGIESSSQLVWNLPGSVHLW